MKCARSEDAARRRRPNPNIDVGLPHVFHDLRVLGRGEEAVGEAVDKPPDDGEADVDAADVEHHSHHPRVVQPLEHVMVDLDRLIVHKLEALVVREARDARHGLDGLGGGIGVSCTAGNASLIMAFP